MLFSFLMRILDSDKPRREREKGRYVHPVGHQIKLCIGQVSDLIR
jgi:hypothetical protein